MNTYLAQVLALTLCVGFVASRTCDRFGAISGCSTNCNTGTEDVEDGGVCGSRRCCRTNCAGPRTFCIGIRQSCESTGEGFDEVDGTCPDDDNFICCAPRDAAPVAQGPAPYPQYETTPPPLPVQYTTTPAPPPPAPETPPPPPPAPETTPSPPETEAPNPEPDNPPKQPPTPPKQPPTPAPPPTQDDQENPSQAQTPPGKSTKYHKSKKEKRKGKKKNMKKAKKAKVGKGKKKSG
eukprot:gene13803-4732_t